MGEYGEPWAAKASEGDPLWTYLTDAGGAIVAEGRRAEQELTRAARCTNALAGAPDAVLESPGVVESLCLEALRSGRTDGTVYAVLADELAARVAGGEGYVSRGELLATLRVLHGRMDAARPYPIHAVITWSRSEQLALAALLDRADPGGPRHDGRDGG